MCGCVSKRSCALEQGARACAVWHEMWMWDVYWVAFRCVLSLCAVCALRQGVARGEAGAGRAVEFR